MNHLTEVADPVAQAAGDELPHLILAAVLHDTVEDSETTLAELTEKFGHEVAALVGEVTDDKTLEKAERIRATNAETSPIVQSSTVLLE